MKRFSWALALIVVGTLVAPRFLAALYGNLGSLTLSRGVVVGAPDVVGRAVHYYQASYEIWPGAHSGFRMLYADHVTNGDVTLSSEAGLEVRRFLDLSRGLLRQDAWKDARFWAEESLRFEQQSDAYYYLGQIATAQGALSEAADYYLQAWGFDRYLYSQNRPGTAYELAATYYAVSNWKEGDRWLDLWVSLPKDDTLVPDWQRLARLNLAGGRVDVVPELLGYAVEARPNDLWPYVSFVALYFDEGMLPEARSICETMPANLQDSASLLRQCGKVFYELSEWERAKGIYQDLVDLEPDNAWAHYRLANIHLHLNEGEQSALCADRARRLLPEDLSMSLAVGAIYEQLGDSSSALEIYNEALKLHPDNSELQAAVARIDD